MTKKALKFSVKFQISMEISGVQSKFEGTKEKLERRTIRQVSSVTNLFSFSSHSR